MPNRIHITPIGDDGLYILNTSTWRSNRPIMNKDICVNCGLCLVYCPVNAIVSKDNSSFEIVYDYCKGCGICSTECPQKAINMVVEDLTDKEI